MDIFHLSQQGVSRTDHLLEERRPHMFDQLPNPHELDDAPELATLAILEVVLQTTISTLLCAYPALVDSERPYWIRRPVNEDVAQRIVARAGALARLAGNYRAALLVANTPRLPETDLDGTDTPC
jgi:hypothetical protein